MVFLVALGVFVEQFDGVAQLRERLGIAAKFVKSPAETVEIGAVVGFKRDGF